MPRASVQQSNHASSGMTILLQTPRGPTLHRDFGVSFNFPPGSAEKSGNSSGTPWRFINGAEEHFGDYINGAEEHLGNYINGEWYNVQKSSNLTTFAHGKRQRVLEELCNC